MADLIPVPRYRYWESRRCPRCGWPVQVFLMYTAPPFSWTGTLVPWHVPRICVSCAAMWKPAALQVTYS